MKKYNYFGRVSGWGICMLFFLTGLFTGCSENEEDYPKGQRPAGIESVRKVACIGNSITWQFSILEYQRIYQCQSILTQYCHCKIGLE